MGSLTPPANVLNGDLEKILNAAKWLGYSINFLAKDAPGVFSFDALQQGNYFSPHRPIKMSEKTQEVDVGAPISTTFLAPANLRVTTDERSAIGELFTRSSGDEVVKTMNVDSNIGAKYLGLSVQGSVGVATSSQFKTDKQYAFLSKNITSYVATFGSDSDQKEFMNSELLQEAAALPEWNYYNSDVVSAYQAFFRAYGTHMINVASYGWRYQLECNQSNSNSEQKESFELNMKVKYEGFDAGAGYKQSAKYIKFNSESSVVVKAIGGSLNLANAVMADPANLDKKASWEAEAGTKADEGLTNLNMVPLAKIFDGLSPAKTYRPITINIAKGLFDLQKACYRTVLALSPIYTISGEVEITSKNGSFILREGEINDKVRKLYYGTPQPGGYPRFSGAFPFQCGIGDTVEMTIRFKMLYEGQGQTKSGPFPCMIQWFPGDGSKGYEVETVGTWPGVDLQSRVPVDMELKYVFHPKPSLGGAFWWNDDDAAVVV